MIYRRGHLLTAAWGLFFKESHKAVSSLDAIGELQLNKRMLQKKSWGKDRKTKWRSNGRKWREETRSDEQDAADAFLSHNYSRQIIAHKHAQLRHMALSQQLSSAIVLNRPAECAAAASEEAKRTH
jgi:hypothetical protein